MYHAGGNKENVIYKAEGDRYQNQSKIELNDASDRLTSEPTPLSHKHRIIQSEPIGSEDFV